MPSSPAENAVTCRRVSKLYGNAVVLQDVTVELPAGSSVVLLGPNGAGKSTLLKLIAGLARPSYGDVRTFGVDPLLARGRVAYMGHSTMIYDELTGLENLQYFSSLHLPTMDAAARRRLVCGALEEVALDPGNPRRVGEYSQGMRQRASLARVLLAAPDLLLLDEPFSNLDVASVQAMLARLQQFLAERTASGQPRTLVFTTHQAELARPLATMTLTLSSGRLIADEAPQSTAERNAMWGLPA